MDHEIGQIYPACAFKYMKFKNLFLFIISSGMACGGFPGPGVEHHVVANPMKDLIHTSASGHSQRVFDHFRDKFQRQYVDHVEHETRQRAFLHNMR